MLITTSLPVPHVHIASCPSSPCPCCLRLVSLHDDFAPSIYRPYSLYPILNVHMLSMPHVQYAPSSLCLMLFMPHAHYTPCPLCSMSTMHLGYFAPVSKLLHAHGAPTCLHSLCLMPIMPRKNWVIIISHRPLRHGIWIITIASCPETFAP